MARARRRTLALLCLLLAIPVLGGFHRGDPPPAAARALLTPFDGVWTDGRAGFLFLEARDGFLSGWGKDTEVVFESNYIIAGDTARGFGSGVNHVLGKRFLYSSVLIATGDGTLSEDWHVYFVDAPERTGRSIFRRPS